MKGNPASFEGAEIVEANIGERQLNLVAAARDLSGIKVDGHAINLQAVVHARNAGVHLSEAGLKNIRPDAKPVRRLRHQPRQWAGLFVNAPAA
jgi:hypothetical protein